MRTKKSSTEYRKRQSIFLLYWRKNVRWKVQAHPSKKNAGKIIPSEYLRHTENDISDFAKLHGITASSFYRAIKGCRFVKSKWHRCSQCFNLNPKEKRYGSYCYGCERERNKEYAKLNPDKGIERSRRRWADPARRAAQQANAKAHYLARKAKGAHLDHKHKRKTLMSLCYSSGERHVRPKSAKCYYCGKKIAGSNMHLDHVVPISRGGSHASFNWVLACFSCNTSKHNKMPNRSTPNGQLEMILRHA
jgi:5-methylcytosine-specific restriction endonuclease McrA